MYIMRAYIMSSYRAQNMQMSFMSKISEGKVGYMYKQSFLQNEPNLIR